MVSGSPLASCYELTSDYCVYSVIVGESRSSFEYANDCSCSLKAQD
jgi:hypothetical protein